MYYVLYHEYGDERVVKFTEQEGVFNFITEVMKEDSDYELDDFEVIFGEPLKLQVKSTVTEVEFADL